MQRSFSEELKTRDYSFEIGGEIFSWRELTWDDLEQLAAEEDEFAKKEDTQTKEAMDFLVKRIIFFLDPEKQAATRFKKLLKRRENPVPHFQIEELHRWLWENVSNRPTSPLSASSNGQESKEVTSQVA